MKVKNACKIIFLNILAKKLLFETKDIVAVGELLEKM
jgi:hypothetical protein